MPGILPACGLMATIYRSHTDGKQMAEHIALSCCVIAISACIHVSLLHCTRALKCYDKATFTPWYTYQATYCLGTNVCNVLILITNMTFPNLTSQKYILYCNNLGKKLPTISSIYIYIYLTASFNGNDLHFCIFIFFSTSISTNISHSTTGWVQGTTCQVPRVHSTHGKY